MKLGTSILLAAGASLGTAFIIDKVTDGAVRSKLGELRDQMIDNDLIDEEFDDDFGPITMMTEVDDDGSGFDVLENCDTGEKKVLMPYDSAMDILTFMNKALEKLDASDREPEALADKLGTDISTGTAIVFAIDDLEDILDNDLYPETAEEYLRSREAINNIEDLEVEENASTTDSDNTPEE